MAREASAKGPGAVGLADLGARPWVVLGGGGMRGLAHIGAWQALIEGGLRPAGIIGTSMGALVGACLAAGMEWDEVVSVAFAIRKSDVARINRRAILFNGIRQEGILLGEPLRAVLEAVLPVDDWTALQLPLQVNAVDLATGSTRWFGTGADTSVTLIDALHASAALPVFYPPVRAGGFTLVDGGVEFTLALERAEECGASGIVAVDVGSRGPADAEAVRAQGMIALHQRVFSIMAERARSTLVRGWDGVPLLLIRPRVEDVGTFEFGRTGELITEGYRASREALAGEGAAAAR